MTKRGYAVFWTEGKSPLAEVVAVEGKVSPGKKYWHIFKPKKQAGQCTRTIYATKAAAHKAAAREMRLQMEYELHERNRAAKSAAKHDDYAKTLKTRAAVMEARAEDED